VAQKLGATAGAPGKFSHVGQRQSNRPWNKFLLQTQDILLRRCLFFWKKIF